VRDGSVYCWGANNVGQLGRPPDFPDSREPFPGPVVELHDAVGVDVGAVHACAVRAGGQVVCWGWNRSGQVTGVIGDGDRFGGNHMPREVAGVDRAVQVSVGVRHSCAVRQEGRVLCWGDNEHGQLGAVAGGPAPVQVPGLEDAVAVAASSRNTCALRRNGDVRCWGADDYGQLGDGVIGPGGEGPDVVGLTDAAAIEAGTHTCALRSTGEIACWGGGPGLGNGTEESSARPARVRGLTDAASIAVGGGSSCAARASGELLCWGSNWRGQIGDGTREHRLEPVVVDGLCAVDEVAIEDTACALQRDGAVLCWGAGGNGTLGNGTLRGSLEPVRVLGLP
ncbi:MAG: RCC1 domain-containing protein, partial [Polyangiales bacterium]